MNKIYRVVWNEASQTAVAVMETTSSHSQRGSTLRAATPQRSSGAKALLTELMLALAGSGLAWAGAPAPTQLPTGAQVVAGQATVTQPASTVLQVQQSSQAAIINWQSFNLGSAASVTFVQPSASSSTLNRVLDSNPSQIFGRITAPGQVFFTNPSGIYFGPGASVDVGGLVATTHSISDADFMAGNYRFERNGASASVVNAGALKAALGGYIALLAPDVRNEGVILAQMGTVALAAGDMVKLDMLGTQLSSVQVSPASIQTLVDNAGAVLAPGGLIILSAQAADQLQGSVVNNSGTLAATGLSLRNGRMVLDAGSNGAVQAGGTLNVSNDAGSGGQISITGKDIVLPGGAQLLATGSQGGGTVLVGGDWMGSSTLQQATTVRMDAGAAVDASATVNGDGGKVVLWSDVHNSSGSTTAAGSILARGGALGGNGGQVETSGYQLYVDGIRVQAGAAHGQGGQWLLDPYDYTIGSGEASSISNALIGGADVTVDTGSSMASGAAVTGAGPGNPGDITVNNAITSTGAGAGALSLIADRNILLNANVTLTGTGKAIQATAKGNIVQASNVVVSTIAGDVIYRSDSDATGGGSILLNAGARVSSTNGNVIFGGGTNLATGFATPDGVTGNAYGVELSAGAIVNAGSGNITLRGKGDGSVSATAGIGIKGASTVVSGANITLEGEGSIASSNTNYGVEIAGGASVSGSGTVNITGRGGWSSSIASYGVVIRDPGTLVEATGTGTVAIHGTGGGDAASSFNFGTVMDNGVSVQTGGGTLVITGTGGLGSGGNNSGVAMYLATLGSANTGAITITGIVGDSGGNGIESFGDTTITSNGGAMRLVADSLNTYATPSSLTFNGTGALTIESVGSSFSAPLGTADLTYASTLTGLTIGKSGNTAGITVANAISIAGPISIYGGNIAVNGALAATGNLLLDADTGSQLSFTGAGVQVNAGLSTSANGNITVHGRGGDAAGGSQFGVALNGTGISAGGTGTVTLTGRGGASTGNNNHGIYSSNAVGSVIQSANGDISLAGFGGGTGNTSALNAGVFESAGSSLLAGGIGTVSITGTGGAAASNGNGMRGIYVNGGSINSSGGAITLTGTGGANATGTASTQSGIQIDSSGSVGALSGNAPITLVGTDTRSGANGIRFFLAALGGSSYTGDVVLRADGISQGAATPATINTSGSLHIEPISSSFIAAMDTTPLALSRLTGLTLGKPGNTAGITVGSAASVSGPVQIYGGNLAINAALSATGSNTITLASSGRITQGAGGSLLANQLLLRGGNAALTNPNNNIGTLAASGVGSLVYTDSDALTIGTVGSTNGISASGAVSVATVAGDLTVAHGVATSDASANALVLNAGQSAAAGGSGSAASGNLLISGSPVLAVGSGGTQKLYSGSVLGSTGLTALVGSGSGNFRYNSDEASAGYTLALAANGPNAIYREQPTITVTADNQLVTYGTAPTLTPSVSSQNGDTVAQAFGTAPSIAVSGSASASGYYTAMTAHSLTASGAIDQLGYAVAYAAPGSLTVNAKTLTLAASKSYDGSASLAGAVALGGLVGSETLTYSAATSSDAHVATAGKYIQAITLADGTLGGVASNYQLPNLNAANAPVSISAKALRSTATIGGTFSKTYNGNTAATGASISGRVTGAVSGDTLALDTSGAALNYNTAHVGSASSIEASGSTGFSIVGSSAGSLTSDYSFTGPAIAAVAAHITPATLTPTLTNTGVTKIYDGDTSAPLGFAPTYTYSGLASGDTAAVLNNTGIAFNSAHVTSANKLTVSGLSISALTGSNNSLSSDYALDASAKDVAASIIQRNITLSSLTTANKTYDGTTAASISSGSFANLAGTEALGINGSGTFANRNAGTGKTVTVSDVTALAKADGSGLWSDYHLTTTGSLTSTANIGPKAVTLSVGSVGKTYDGLPGYSTLSGDLVALSSQLGVGGDTVSAASLAFLDKNAGTGKTVALNSVSVSDGNAGNNYVLSLVGNSNSAIAKADAVVIGASDSTRVYNGSTQTVSGFSASGLVNGETASVLSGVSASGSGRNAGSYAVSPTGTDSNYKLSFVDGSLQIARKAVTLSAGNVAKTYDGLLGYTAQASDLSALSSQLGLGGDTVSAANIAFLDKNAGTGKTVALNSVSLNDGNGGNNYTLSLTGNSSGIIAKADAVVTGASDSTRVYNGSTQTLSGFSASGLVNGETASVLGGVSASGSGKNTGSFVVTPTGTDANYSLSFVDGVLQISKAALTASLAGTVQKQYDGLTAVTNLVNRNFAITGWAGSEGATVSQTGGSYASKNVSDNPGNGLVSTTLASSQFSAHTGTDLNNYLLPVAASGLVGRITPAPLGVQVNQSATFVTLDANSAPDMGFSFSGLQNGETATSVLGNLSRSYSGSTATPAAGSYSGVFGLSSTPVAANGNYTVSVSKGNLLVAPADHIIINIGSNAAVYDQRNTGTVAATAQGVSVDYMAGGTTLAHLAMQDLGNGVWQATDGTGQTLRFSTLVNNPGRLSSGGYLPVGNYGYGASATSGSARANFGGEVVNGGVLTITPKLLSVSGNNLVKTYDGSTALPSVALTPDNRLAGDVLDIGFGAGSFAGRNAGTQGFSLSGLTLGGADKRNYALASSDFSGTGTIRPKSVTLSASGLSKTYDASTSYTTGNRELAQLSAALGVAGDQVTAATLAFADAAAGSGKTASASAALVSDGNGGGNYQLAYASSSTSQILKKEISLVSVQAANKVYDGSLLADIVSGSLLGLVGSETLGVQGQGRFADRNAGSGKTVTVTVADVSTLTGVDGSGLWNNYRLASAGRLRTTADIAKKSVTLSAASASKTYDGVLAYSPQSSDLLALSSQLGVSGDTVTAASMAYTDAHAGADKTLTLDQVALNDGNAGNNYTLTLAGNHSSAITPALLTVRAHDAIKAQDGAAFVGGNGVSYAGFVQGETDAVLGGTLAYGGNSQGAVAPGNYAIAAQGLSAANYRLQYQPGTLRIVAPPPLPVGGGNGNGNGNGFGFGGGGPNSSVADTGATGAFSTAGAAEPGGSASRSGGGGGLASALGSGSESASVQLQLVRQPTEQSSGFTLVYVPTSLKNAAQGFRFTLPPHMQGEEAGDIRVSTLAGQPLPDWLHYDSEKRMFLATGVPPGGLPLRVLVVSGHQRNVLELLEANT